MGALKLTYHESQTAISENWKIFVRGIEKKASSQFFCKDYFTGHALMPGRHGNSDSYRYGGANGQEKIDEVAGEGNHYTAEYWEYSPRIMRRWNQDPKPNPAISNYAVYANNPILYVDPKGDTTEYYDYKSGEYLGTIYGSATYGVGFIKKSDFIKVREQTQAEMKRLGAASNEEKYFDENRKKLGIYQKRIDWTTTGKVTDAYSPYSQREGRDCHKCAQNVLGGPHVGPEGQAKVFNEVTGLANMPEQMKGVQMLSGELHAGNPVMVGLDNRKGGDLANENYDGIGTPSTDHYVTAVKLGADSRGAYFQVTDNGLADMNGDTDPSNRLYLRTGNQFQISGATNFTIQNAGRDPDAYGSGWARATLILPKAK